MRASDDVSVVNIPIFSVRVNDVLSFCSPYDVSHGAALLLAPALNGNPISSVFDIKK